MSAAEKAAQGPRYNTVKHTAVSVSNPEGLGIEIIQLSWWKMAGEIILLLSMTIPNHNRLSLAGGVGHQDYFCTSRLCCTGSGKG